MFLDSSGVDFYELGGGSNEYRPGKIGRGNGIEDEAKKKPWVRERWFYQQN